MEYKPDLNNLLSLFHEFDILWLSELKANHNIHLPGFYWYRNNSTRYDNHGGIILFVKDHLNIYLKGNFERADGIWLSLKTRSDVLFGVLDIPPTDSRYYNDVAFSSILTKTQFGPRKLVLIGDFNSKIKRIIILFDRKIISLLMLINQKLNRIRMKPFSKIYGNLGNL